MAISSMPTLISATTTTAPMKHAHIGRPASYRVMPIIPPSMTIWP